jgi:hypothetical protein
MYFWKGANELKCMETATLQWCCSHFERALCSVGWLIGIKNIVSREKLVISGFSYWTYIRNDLKCDRYNSRFSFYNILTSTLIPEIRTVDLSIPSFVISGVSPILQMFYFFSKILLSFDVAPSIMYWSNFYSKRNIIYIDVR